VFYDGAVNAEFEQDVRKALAEAGIHFTEADEIRRDTAKALKDALDAADVHALHMNTVNEYLKTATWDEMEEANRE
jgi:hypothetical protein